VKGEIQMNDFFFSQKITRFSASLFIFAAIVMLAGCTNSSSGGSTTTTPTTTTAATLQLSALPAIVKSDNTNSATITVTAVDAANVVVSGTTVNFSTNTGALSLGQVTTDSTGKATLTFSSGTLSKVNRIATITATAGAITTTLPVQISGSTVVVNLTAATLPDNGNSPVPMTITAKDAGGNAIPNATVTITTGGVGTVTLQPACTLAVPCTTDSLGNLNVIATGAAPGTITLTIASVGATATSTLTISPSASTFAIDQQTLNGVVIANNALTAMKIGDTLDVRVNAPTLTTSVVFVTSVGSLNGVLGNVTVPVAGGKATATLTTTAAGTAGIQVYDLGAPSTSDNLAVTMTAATANSISIQASPGLVSKNTGISTLTALVKDINNYPVGGAQVAFSIINSTGGGETVSPVVATTATVTGNGVALGEARTTFTAGSISSSGSGVQVRASVVGFPAVATEKLGDNLTSSGNDASIVIGGTAGSVAFGQATVLGENSNATAYVLPMSVLVADSGGNPVPGAVVNLSVWPIAWSTSSVPCTIDSDTASTGTFFNEDANENLNLDSGEDGKRDYYAGTTPTVTTGTKDSLITAPNSAGGTLPGTVTTGADGVATFDLTYTKTSGYWIIDRIRARTSVQGSETIGETSFRLSVLEKDVKPNCLLPPSPYHF
jgi:Bacterial Ig-like domain (group 1)